MSFLHTRLSVEPVGTKRSGHVTLFWNCGETVVTTVSAQDTRGDLEIRWDHNYEGISACLTVQEARLLHRQLTVLLGEFTGIDNEVEDQEPVNDDGVCWPAPEWVQQALKHGFPSRAERVDSRENHSGTTGPEGAK